MKYADDTNVSEYIVDHAVNSSLQELIDFIVAMDLSRRNKFSLIHQNVLKNLTISLYICMVNTVLV